MTHHPAAGHMATNLKSWDERVAIHTRDDTGFYGIEDFLDGADTLMPIEAVEIGGVSGKRIAHLQCHFGIDTLSLARRGAVVSGLDFSPKAIAQANSFKKQTGIDATFVCANVYDALKHLPPGGFDRVFVSWGAINWLPDINRWAAIASALLTSGGKLYLVECHPVASQMHSPNGVPEFDWPWRAQGESGAMHWAEPVTYNGDETPLQNPDTWEWVHPLSDIINALLANGMQLDFLHEHDILPWPTMSIMEPCDEHPGMFRLPEGVVGPPVAFSLQVTKI